MAIYSLNYFAMDGISTSNAQGFDHNSGSQFQIGVDTVTLSPGQTAGQISVSDTGNDTLDDDAGSAQVLNGAQDIDGIHYADGTVIEAEYVIKVQDSQGNTYTLQFLSLNNDAFTVHGFVVQGAMPPAGEPLTVVEAHDVVQGVYGYSSSNPACFAAWARISTLRGQVEAGRLRRGDWLHLAGGRSARVEAVLRTTARFDGPDCGLPIRLRAGALGQGLPGHDLVLSPQHRVYVTALGALVPARALTVLPRVGVLTGLDRIDYVHVVLGRHDLLLAERLPCESFWPGPVAMAGLSSSVAGRIRRIMGQAPRAAAPMLRVTEARRRLRRPLPATPAP